MVGGQVNPVISVIIDENNKSTSGFKIFLTKYNSLYADDLDGEKVSTPLTERVVKNGSLHWNFI